ncbi:MAG: glucose-1-phosphate adenylyltransferase [Bacilli bacterium]|nr:glucose-1-phosphate adenylyltransferase [Bacilli bacterium]
MKKEVVAMILAGGKGTRLEALTKKVAKPAVNFGGKYRIIDFPISNCVHSDIDTVGVLTQYESVDLNNYVGDGTKWGLDGVRSLISLLPARQTEEGMTWYGGTADAIYRNIDFLDKYNPDYILVLSGDHIYKMNYKDMLKYHKKTGADATIAVINVSKEEASRFGIMNVNQDMSIYEFEEKPKEPKSTLASMGIYIFSYKQIKEALIHDNLDPNSSHDFGKDIIPYYLANGRKLMAYQFDGYWRDVGTVNSLWQANMDLLDNDDQIDLYTKSMRIFSEDTNSVPQYVGKLACVSNSMINQGAIVLGNVEHSVVSNEVFIDEDSIVKDSVIMPGAVIKKGCKISHAVIAPHAVIEDGKIIEGTIEKIVLANE